MDDTRPHISLHLSEELCAVSGGLTDISDKKVQPPSIFGCCVQREGNVLAWFVSVSVSLAPPFFSLAAPPEGTRLACQLADELAC